MWDDAADIVRYTDTKAQIRGIAAQMDSFFGLVLGEMLLRHTDNLSRTLQNKKCSAAEGQAVAQMTVNAIQSTQSDAEYDLFWEKVTKMASELDVSEAKLPRKRKVPRRYDSGHAEAEFHSSPKSHYRQIYYEAVDLIVQSITERFNQPGYKVYLQLENLLIKAAKEEKCDELQFLSTFYGTDINKSNLEMQLATFAANFTTICHNFTDI